MIDVNAFRRFMRSNTPTAPGTNDLAEYKATIRRQNQQYLLSVGLCYLLSQVCAGYVSATATEKLRLARVLSNPEVGSQPQRWAEQFECMADDAVNDDHRQLFSLASDLCAVVKADAGINPGDFDDEPTAAHEGIGQAYINEKVPA